MMSSSQIKKQISRLLDDQIVLQDFEDWLVQNTWNVHLSGSAEVEDLTFATEEALAEYSSERINKQELQKRLGELVYRDIKVLNFNYAPASFSFTVSSFPVKVLTARL